jgi:hypothetical protein
MQIPVKVPISMQKTATAASLYGTFYAIADFGHINN